MAEAKATENDAPSGGRRLGIQEILYHNSEKDFSGSIYIHMFVIESSQSLPVEAVKEAWKILYQKQEALQMRIVEGEGGALDVAFKPMENTEEIPFRVIKLDTKDSWITVCDPKRQEKFDERNGPLWDVLYSPLEDSTSPDQTASRCIMVIRIHHAIADAKSGFDVIYRQYLPILSAIVNKGEPENVVPFIPQCKSSDEMFFSAKVRSAPTPWYIKAGISVLRWYNRTFKSDPLKLVFPEEEGDTAQASVGLIPVVFDKELSVSVMKSAKAHGVTVHSVLLTALGVAVCRTAKEAGIKLPSKLKQMWPMDTRKFVPLDTPHPLGSYTATGVSECKRKEEYTQEEFWKQTKNFYQTIKKQIPEYKNALFLKIMKHFFSSVDENPADAMAEMGFSAIGILSNLGNCDAGPEPQMTDGQIDIKLREHYFTVSVPPNGDMDFIPFFHTVSTFRGHIMWLTALTGQVSAKFGEVLLGNLKTILETYCQADALNVK